MIHFFCNKKKYKLQNSVFIFDGNSLTNRGVETSYSTYLHNLEPFASCNATKWLNYGVGGQRTEQMISDFDTQILPQKVDGVSNFLLCFESLNYIAYYGSSARSALDLWWQYCDHARLSGFKVVTATAMDMYRTTSYDTPTTYRAKISDLNTLIRLEYKNHVHALCDLGAIPELQDATNRTYFLDDLHWNDTGKQIGAQEFKNTLLKIIV